MPTATNGPELVVELRALYKEHPHQWNAITSETVAKDWTEAKTSEVVKDFCDWCLCEGWEGRTFQKISARLKRWIKDEPRMSQRTRAAGGKGGAPAVYEKSTVGRTIQF